MADSMTTPVRKRDRRRVSFVARRALGSPKSPFSPGARQFRGNNDKLEKLARRRSMAQQRAEQKMASSPLKTPRRTNIRPSSQTKSADVVPDDMSANQLTDLYANCIKMCSENKINQKNSWELPLIDYISDVMSSRPGELTNFQMASVTLDASVKIYSCRVDSIHSEAYKVLGGISRSDNKARGGHGDDDGDDDDQAEEGGKKKRKRRTRVGNTLESNPASLNVKKFDLQFDVDPLFKQTSAAFDEGGARGLLLNHITVDEDGTLIFDSQGGSVNYAKEDPAIPADAFNNLFDEWTQGVEDFQDLQICPSLSEFVFMGWEPSKQGSGAEETVAVTGQKQRQQPQQQQVPPTPMKLNMNAEGGQFDLNQSDDDGDDFYDAFADAFEDTILPGQDDANNPNITQAAAEPKPKLGLAPFSKAMAVALQEDGGSEYSYFNEAAMKNWAGPSHWKFQKKHNDKKGGDQANGKKQKKKKEKFFVDFESEASDWDACFATSRAATTLAKSTLSRKPEEFLLPVDVQYKVETLTKLFTNPAMRIVHKSEDASDDYGSSDAQWYDYNNPNDANNYCGGAPGVAFEDDGDDNDLGGLDDDDAGWSDTEGNDGSVSALGASGAATNLSALDTNMSALPQPLDLKMPSNLALVDEPTKAQKIHINYAKHAKRINVKQVKSSMWSKLTSASKDEDDQENNGDENVVESEYGQKFNDVTQEHYFSDVVHEVPEMVPPQMGEQLSVPIMFVCLLHLANEKHLKITNGGGEADTMDDLAIIQG